MFQPPYLSKLQDAEYLRLVEPIGWVIDKDGTVAGD